MYNVNKSISYIQCTGSLDKGKDYRSMYIVMYNPWIMAALEMGALGRVERGYRVTS